MTAQFFEKIIFEGKEYGMAAEPLSEYLLLQEKSFNLVAPHTACWRGYVGTWQVVGNRLYLIDIEAYIKDFEEVNLDYFFPGESKVFASWFTGEVRLPYGELLKYVHGGYRSTYEKDLFLKFDKGLLTGKRVEDNRLKNNEKDEYLPF